MEQIRASSPAELADNSFPFSDSRLSEMLFRYRARNYPDSLSPDEQAQWEEHRFAYLSEPDAGASVCLEQFHQIIDDLLASDSLGEAHEAILHQLLEYSDTLLA